jgi:LAS superfamily LD-carboxypeptidase LdcB
MDSTVAYYGQALVYVGQQAGANPRVTSGLRTWGQQLKLYLKRVAGLSPYPALPPGSSMHELGRAFDLATTNDAFWLPQLGALWKSWGGRWSSSDPIHFEA